jgi:hypothetical protein
MSNTKSIYWYVQQAEQRRYTTEAIANYIDRCLERDEQLRQLQSWMETASTEELSQPFWTKETSECPFSPELLEDTRSLDINKVIEAFQKTMGKLKVIADSLGIGEPEKEEEELIPEPQETAKKEPVRLPFPTRTKVKKIFDRESL